MFRICYKIKPIIKSTFSIKNNKNSKTKKNINNGWINKVWKTNKDFWMIKE